MVCASGFSVAREGYFGSNIITLHSEPPRFSTECDSYLSYGNLANNRCATVDTILTKRFTTRLTMVVVALAVSQV